MTLLSRPLWAVGAWPLAIIGGLVWGAILWRLLGEPRDGSTKWLLYGVLSWLGLFVALLAADRLLPQRIVPTASFVLALTWAMALPMLVAIRGPPARRRRVVLAHLGAHVGLFILGGLVVFLGKLFVDRWSPLIP